jgi:hypothetical protein
MQAAIILNDQGRDLVDTQPAQVSGVPPRKWPEPVSAAGSPSSSTPPESRRKLP